MSQRLEDTGIDEYLASLAPDARGVVKEIRKVVQRTVPAAEETIGEQVPVFKLRRTIIYFAAFNTHVGVSPPVEGEGLLAKALLPYRSEKGDVKLPLDQPVPYELIGRVAAALAEKCQ